MKTAFAIFARDVRRIVHNPLALIILAGALVLPSLYAWYCVAANWDPYERTDAIHVAVVNKDVGATSDIAGHLDIGAEVVASLSKNHELGWEFVTEEEALRGVDAGTYYAAIIIPDTFSADFASVFSDTHTRPHLTYYVNEKLNAAAVKITDVGAQTLDEQINAQFTAAVSSATSDLLRTFAHTITKSTDRADGVVAREVASAHRAITQVRETLNTTEDTLDQAQTATDATHTTLDDLSARVPLVSQSLDAAYTHLMRAREIATDLAQGLNHSTGQAAATLGSTAAMANAEIGALSGDILKAQGQVDQMLADANRIVQENQTLIDELRGLEDEYPEVSDVIAQLEASNEQQQRILDALSRTSASIASAATASEEASGALNTATQEGLSALRDTQNELSTEALPNLEQGLDAASRVAASLSGAAATLEPSLQNAKDLLGTMQEVLHQAASTLAATDTSLAQTQDTLTSTLTDLTALGDAALTEALTKLWGIEPSQIAHFFDTPVRLQTETMYPVATYGSGVAPFYTNVALWVGGFILTILIKQEVDPAGIKRMSATQSYVGRGLLFVVLGVLQAFIICGGDLILGIQCENPLAFLVAGVFTSFVYIQIIYALASTFRHIGKALAIVILILQIPGSAGMYPIEMMPQAFQAIYPFLPFTYGINAMRETIAGMYGWHYFFDLARLALFLPVAWLIGLIVRSAVINVDIMFDRRLANTGVFASERGGFAQEHHHLRTAVLALLQTPAYRRRITKRVACFNRYFPALMRGALILLIALPLLLLGVASLLQVSVNAKIGVLIAVVIIFVHMGLTVVVLAYAREHLRAQHYVLKQHTRKQDNSEQHPGGQRRADSKQRRSKQHSNRKHTHTPMRTTPFKERT